MKKLFKILMASAMALSFTAGPSYALRPGISSTQEAIMLVSAMVALDKLCSVTYSDEFVKSIMDENSITVDDITNNKEAQKYMLDVLVNIPKATPAAHDKWCVASTMVVTVKLSVKGIGNLNDYLQEWAK